MTRVEHLVFLHGWGGDARIWQPLLETLASNTAVKLHCIELPVFAAQSGEDWPPLDTLLQKLYRQLPSNCILVGHSLGGMLAVRLASLTEQDKVLGLVTIAANACFVERDGWPGMAETTFEAFYSAFTTAPDSTWERFCSLQARGDTAMRSLLKSLKTQKPQMNNDAWRGALRCLAELDNRQYLANLSLPALFLFGDRDALVPIDAAGAIEAIGGDVEVIDGTGHLPHCSRADITAEYLLEIMRRVGNSPAEPFDKSAVARSFTRAAQSYDDCAYLQRAVCRQLLSQADVNRVPRTILDLGSGTGFGTELLRQRFPQAQIIALDLAEGMLKFARAQRPEADGYVAADAEQLPLAAGSIDLVFSSMALQWCYRLPQLFAELQRIMVPGGRCLVATLGPRTLVELKQSWAQVDGGVHVNQFLPAGQWREAALHCGLDGQVSDELRRLHFDSLRQLMRELKGVGAHNINRAADKGMTGRRKLQRLSVSYEEKRQERGLPVTYEVIYMNLSTSEAKKAG
ncbi:malonyl-[acyl-carrier protein] O-methyltransferase BioC [Microbulbifer sp. A4B17]|uniref:malonyl-ACP O-methyltransferase BioC n=1 Tax=Microbulbifer sp. A4B17 TaxID=359370 RepID=UPI000D52E268|nr:malonyl-ACP O-methyltransferase BioC [Microbulbifer sp. A4B17]AWF79704.1 malonyl-[acyl-carrier protein] O-methyltransferase BioC [Microbulbifer sp. A4B17]